MAAYNVQLLGRAQQELEEIAKIHLALSGPISAKKITDQILKSLSVLAEFPLSSPVISDSWLQKQEYRYLISGQYLCFYRLIGQTVFVYHIVHGKTDYPKLFASFEEE